MGRMTAAESLEPLRLHFKSERRVVVTTDDEDRFVTTARQAALACRRAQDEQEWKEEFQRFLGFINAWCEDHSEGIVRAYLGFGDEGLKVFLITKGDEYRFDLDELVARLDSELAVKFPGCPADLMHLPDRPLDALRSFFSPPKALQLYGE